MLTVTLLLLVAALGCTLFHAAGKLPLWVAVLLLVLAALLGVLPR